MPKTICFAFLLFLIIGLQPAFAQTAGKMNYPLIRSIEKSPDTRQTAFVKADPVLLKKQASQFNIKVAYSSKNISVVEGKGSDLKTLANQSFIIRMESTKQHLQVLDDSSLSKNNVNIVHSGAAPLATGYTGKDVIVGVIDTGIDFGHPDFKDSTGKTRLLWIWDQDNIDTFNIPQPYNYGRDWNNSEIDSGWCTTTDYTNGGHGTKVSGVAVGNGMTEFKYRGIAPEADLIVVSVDFNSTASVITDAINYIFEKADAAGKPCVINISLGDYYGSHDGTDLQAQMIDNMITAQPARAIVAANGNGGNIPFHLGYDVTSDTSFTWISNNTNEIIFDVYADSSAFTNVRWAVGVSDINFAYEGNIGFRASDSILNVVTEDTLRYLGNQIGIVYTFTEIIDSLVILSVYIAPDSLNYLWSFETTGAGKFDSWNFDYKYNGLPGTSVRSDMIHYKRTDTLQTVCTSYQCSDEVICVGNYVGRNSYVDVTDSLYFFPGVVDSIWQTSSMGPTRDGRLKPDISATGENIVTVGERSFMDWLIINYPYIVTKDSMHMIFGGTSAASPVVAGMAALYFEMHPTATHQQLKQDIINCAKHDLFTGPTANNKYGHGKLDAYGALTCQNPIGIKYNTPLVANELLVYPNPADQFINLTFKNENSTAKIEIINVLGQEVYQSTIKTSIHTINSSSLSPGIYIVKVTTSTNKLSRKIIIE
ncbi:MAG: S8 family peptidase [Bacteroidota bacterium]|nr:S8 family peptidase [Bacteroidota bacterium]